MTNLDNQIKDFKTRLYSKIDDQADAAKEYYNNWKTSKEPKTGDLELLTGVLKRKGFQKYGELWTCGFVCVELGMKQSIIMRKNKRHMISELTSAKVWLDIPKTKTTTQTIDTSILSGVIIAINYFNKML